MSEVLIRQPPAPSTPMEATMNIESASTSVPQNIPQDPAKKRPSADLKKAVVEILSKGPMTRNEIRASLGVAFKSSEDARLASTMSNLKRDGHTVCEDGKFRLVTMPKPEPMAPLKDRMISVMGTEKVTADEVHERLSARGWQPSANDNDTKRYVVFVLTKMDKTFEKFTGQRFTGQRFAVIVGSKASEETRVKLKAAWEQLRLPPRGGLQAELRPAEVGPGDS